MDDHHESHPAATPKSTHNVVNQLRYVNVVRGAVSPPPPAAPAYSPDSFGSIRFIASCAPATFAERGNPLRFCAAS